MEAGAIILVLVGAGFAWWLGRYLLRTRQRHHFAQQPLLPGLKAIAWSNIPQIRSLPVDLQMRLEGLINIFLWEKRFTGFEGLQVTDEMRVTIAAQACLLLVGRQSDGPVYSSLTNIYLYPGAFTSMRERVEGGIVHRERTARTGESWQHGPVVLSWDDAKRGGLNPDDAYNVVYHEFAHQLDQESGDSDGFPKLAGLKAYGEWRRVFQQEYEALHADIAAGRETLIDPYGATNPAEFFAVATETFFEKPQQLRRDHSALYDQLAGYYQLDLANL